MENYKELKDELENVMRRYL